MKLKVCKLCNKELSIDNFWKNLNLKDKVFSTCKICTTKVKDINILKKQKYLQDNLWTCSTCHITLLLNKENFYKRNDSSTGFQHRCKKCLKKDPTRYNRLIKKDDLDLFLKDVYYGAKHRSIKRNIKFELTLEYLKNLWNNQNGLCAISKLKMTHTILEGKLKTNLSIDKINPTLGYTKDNIQLVCNIINVMKSNMSIKDLIYFCKLIIQENE